jgi:hypothetical protein
MIQGMCPSCHLNRNQVTTQSNTNAVNSTLIVNQQPKQ